MNEWSEEAFADEVVIWKQKERPKKLVLLMKLIISFHFRAGT